MSPSPSPPPIQSYLQLPPAQTKQVMSAVQHLNEYRWHDAFEAICVIGDAMRTTPTKHLSLHLLSDINQLFATIMHHHAYGVQHQVDDAINHLLRYAIRTCQEARESQYRTYCDGSIGWMTPIEVEIGQHLQFYRTFCRYLENYSLYFESDRILHEIRKLLQKLCPTVNNLTGWVPVTPPRDIRQDIRGATAKNPRRSQRLRSYHSTLEPAASNSRQQRRPLRLRRAKVPPPRQLPTPPTQTDDLVCFCTYETDDYVPTLPTPITPFSAPPCSSQLPKVTECREELEEELTQLVGSRVLQFVKPPASRPRSVNLPADFMLLRPVHVHVTSQRCCSGL